MNAQLEARLEELLDKEEIREVMMLYCRGVDRHDRALIEAASHPDATDYGRGPKASRMVDFILSGDPTKPYSHFIGNQMIVVTGDSATCESYFISISEVTRDGEDLTRIRGGRYIDRFLRHEGKWKVRERLSTTDWSRLDRIVERVEMNDDHPRGVGSKEDAVYKIQ